MSYLWFVVEVLASTVNCYLSINFIIRAFEGKCKHVSVRWAKFIGTSAMLAASTLLNWFQSFEGVSGLIYSAVFILFSIFFVSGSMIKKIFLSLLTNAVLICTASVSASLMLAFLNEDSADIYAGYSFDRLVFIIMGLVLAALVFELLLRFICRKKDFLGIKEWVLILLELSISYFVIAVIHSSMVEYRHVSSEFDRNIVMLLIAEIGIVVMIVLSLYLMVSLNALYMKERELELEKKRIEFGSRYSETVREQYNETRRIRHDMKQYIGTIHALLEDGKYDSAKETAAALCDNIFKTETLINVDNDFLNAVLNTKFAAAKSKEIDTIFAVEKGNFIADEIDLCTLFGNLLDNAISAAEKCPPESRLIEMKISSSENKMNIVIKNSITRSVLSVNPQLITSKSDSSNHGFGIKSIRQTAEKYNGKVDFYEEGLTFISSVTLFRK